MSLRIMSDLDLSSSDEEIFDGSPSTKSTNTSLNSTNSGSKQRINNDFVIKDVSVKVTQLPIVKSEKHKKNTPKDTQIKKKKRVVRKWRKGIITRRKENSSKRTKPITLKLAENKTEEHAQDQSRIIEEKSTDVHQKLQLAKSCISENLEISDEKKDTEIDRTYTSARILPYDFYRNKNMPTTKYFNFPPFLNDENLEQYLCENNMSGDTACLIRRAWKAQRQLQESKLRRKKLYKQLLKQKKTITDKELLSSISSFLKKNNHIDTDESDSSVEFQPVVKKRRRRISSSESSENIIDNNNSNSRPYLSYEGTKQAESQIKIREVKIILTRIEDMINMDTIKQKQGEDASEISKSTVLRQLNTEKARKSSTKVTSEKENSYITVKDQETVQRQNNELILTRNDGPSQTKDISNDSRLSITSNTHVQKNLKQSDDLYIRKLKKKYKLFKKPRVLLIKLETLQISVKNNQYSASEVERLTKKYINFVIKSNRFTSRTSYEFRQLQNKSTDVNIVHTVDDNASINSQNVTRNSTEFAERSPTKDNKPTENNSVKATSLKKFPLSNNLMSMIPIDQYKLLQLHKDKNSVSPEKKQEGFSSQKLLKIWQNAFCKKSTEQSQKTTAKKQSASLQSPSVSQDPSKNSADMKFTSVFNHVASTSLSSTKDDAFATDPKRVGSPKKQAETTAESETAECETVFESLTNCVSLSSNENVEKTIFKNNPLQQNNKQILKSPLDNKNDKNIASRSCLNLMKKMTENAEKDSLKLPGKSSAKSNNITSFVRETKSPRSKTSPQVPQITCEMTKITFKCAKCDIVFEQFRAWQEHHLYLCKQNAIVNSSSGNVLKQQNVESLNPLMSQKTSGNTKSKSPSSQQTLEKRTITCRSCLKVFDNNFQYFEHLNQTNCQFKRVCPIDKTASTSQKTDKQNDQAFKSILRKVIELRAPEKTFEVIEDKLGNTSRDNVKESNAKRRLVTSEVLHDASKQRNETSNLPKTTEQNKQSIPATRETENHDDKEKRQAAKPFTICKCHRNIKIVNGENVPIEIVLQCTCCDVLFRLLECFEAHSQSSVFPSCASNSQNNKKAQLFCNICQVMMNSLKDMYRHLAIHAKINRKGTVTFRCNICKLAFYGLGPLFNAHFNNHEKSPGFRSNHLDFPTNTYVGSRLIKMPSADNEKQMNIYYEMADHICPKCKTPFYTPLAVRLHMVTCNVGNVSVVDNNASSTVAKTSIKKKQLILICGFCNKKFCNKAVFDQHSSEHKQKRELNSYYTCVTVTAITKVYICKVCTSMWQSLKEFEEHWRTHGELREDYVCSICESHFNAFDLFEKHVITHKKSVSCKVIYRDVNEQNSTTTSHRQDNDNLFLASVSSCHEETESIGEKSVTSDKVLSVVTPRKSVIKKSLCEKQNQPTETITTPISDSISSTDITQKSTEAKKNTTTISANDCPKIDNNAKKNNNNETNNLDNLEDSDEDNLVIALSDEENTVSNIVVGNTINNVPLIEHNDDTEKRRAATSNSAATVEQRKQSTDLESVVSSAAISSATNVSEGVSNVITQGEINAQLDKSSDVSGNKEACVDDMNVRSSKTAQDNRANDAIVHPVIIDVVSLNENSKELSNNDINTKSKESSNNDTSTEPEKLSKDKNTENKTFLRVKSLAELTNTPLRSHICYECGQPFDCVQKLTEHITQHDTERRKQASLFNPPIFLAQTPNLAPQPRVPPPSIVNSNQSQQHPILSATSRQYQVIGVKPLHLVAYTVVENKKVSPNVLQYEVPWIPHQKNTSAVVTQSSMIQQPTCQPISQVSHQTNKLIQNNNVQQITLVQQQQQQNTSTVAVRPFMQNFNQGSVSQSVLYEQQQRQQRRQRQLQQWQQQQQQRQQLRQQEIQQQRLQQQQLLQQQRQLQQQQLQQQRLQQQQQLQQRQRDNVVHNQYLAPQRNVSSLAQNNTVPAYPANNNASEDLNTIQQAKTPEHLTCLYCPGFECSSIHDFAAHLRSPKHEARSHYNDVPYSS